MTREEYIEQKNSGKFNYEMFWEYYNSQEGAVWTEKEFMDNFNSIFQQGAININVLMNRVGVYMDNKFTAVKLSDRDGTIIKWM
jgi:hypothetical protein